ncbi:hypothetical protein Pelo_10416 [Pelomyxa schiedti]|nr:hypothetical protein Pelo_10416 [Pelomyxa schiedti]
MKRKKVVVHMDLNGTCVTCDTANHDSLSNVINTYLSGLLWTSKSSTAMPVDGERSGGDPPVGQGDADWKFSLWNPDVDSCECLYKIAEAAPEYRENRAAFKKMVGNFTARGVGACLRPQYDRILSSWRVPDSTLAMWSPKEREVLSVPGDDGLPYFFVVPSFWYLLDWLIKSEAQIDWCILFRTYGTDEVHLLECIQLFGEGKIPPFPARSFPLDKTVMRLTRTNTPPFFTLSLSAEAAPLSGEVAIADYVEGLSGMHVVSDDYYYWRDTNFEVYGAKPMWLRAAPDTTHIFFDDNIRPGLPSIVDVRSWDPTLLQFRSCAPASQNDLVTRVGTGRFQVKAHLLETVEPNFFIAAIQSRW